MKSIYEGSLLGSDQKALIDAVSGGCNQIEFDGDYYEIRKAFRMIESWMDYSKAMDEPKRAKDAIDYAFSIIRKELTEARVPFNL